MELNCFLLALTLFFVTFGDIEMQWNSRPHSNSPWQTQRRNNTNFQSNRHTNNTRYNPGYGNSSFTGNHHGWTGGNSHYNTSHQPYPINHNQRYNSSRLYPELPRLDRREDRIGRGTGWTQNHAPGTGGLRNNSTRLYPSLDYFRGRFENTQNNTGRPYVYQNYGNSSFNSGPRYKK